jgi:2-dehydropantoate 2-reductase
MASIESVAVIGAGAMGAVYASKLFDMDKDCVSLIAHNERHDQLKKKGLIVNKKHYAIPVVRPDNTLPSDLIIVAVKHHHLPTAIQDIKNAVGSHSIIISVMNGITSEEQIGAVYGMDKVLYAVALGIDAVRQGNEVTYTTQGKLLFGEAQNPVCTERVKRVQSLFERAGIAHETPEDMIRTLWYKFMINVGINPISAVLRAPYGVFQTSHEAKEIMEEAMQEVVLIANAANVNLSQHDIKQWHVVLSTLSPLGRTSMLQDVEAKRKTEVEMFAGKVTDLGKTYDIPTPVNQILLDMIKVIEQRYGE